MRAMVLHEFSSPLQLGEVPDPKPGLDEVVVKVRACAPDMLDVKTRAGQSNITLPRIIGHEIAGEIAEVGASVKNIRLGERVVVYDYLNCGACEFCWKGRETLCRNNKGIVGLAIDGGFADYIKVPGRNVLPIPTDVSDEAATTLVSPVSTSLHALRERARVSPGDYLLIVGAAGGVGIHMVQMAQLFGARVIAADVSDEKNDKTKKYGAEAVINTMENPFGASFDEAVLEATGGTGVQSAIDLYGSSDSLAACYRCLDTAGTLVRIGSRIGDRLEIDPEALTMKEVVLTGCRYNTKEEFNKSLELVRAGKIEPVVSFSFPLSEVNDVLDKIERNEVFGRGVAIL
ncbi:MAG: alcohol dehydrogenase catalytic domain-containing protein [Nitrospinaceae bacterium]|nr:alcohol dehydrogenase catalytic domain-containing protein [Nitrospinaceae bacterium]MBT3434245.1 alcohol dehydrogenase catalytic domain-containing protein [Nitrospinaceae bacterium]MBT4093705.1 alcohol dehydrogenase catalytic domain-containing protein [Nitrospinaceae bacterium]MBT4432419.1 alcohol dehydrogenase catalytic domain-containing protein [Nitrospinaceae bacterium]MBT5368400.1 alcohol dehydrogenase catalytic domain-containing protein [Nitrospinaceae bacterium]